MTDNRTLRLRRPLMRGPAVTRLQELGDMLGFDYGPNDGVFGRKTKQAVIAIQDKLELEPDGICGPKTWEAIFEHADNDAGTTFNRTFVDIRGTHEHPRLYDRQRPWSDIIGVLMHQCGCAMPKNPRAWTRLNAHIATTLTGSNVLVNDFTDLIHHGNGLSRRYIGYEIAGNHCGIAGDLKTLWKGGGGPHSLNLDMKLASDEVFGFIKGEFEDNHQQWLEIKAHRQSSDTRRADPGEQIWKSIAMVWAKRLGLDDYDGGGTFKKKKGFVIPVDWNPEYSGKY